MSDDVQPGSDGQRTLGRGFQRSAMDELDDERFQQLVWLLDRQAELPAIRRIREWTLDQLAPMPGERAVDIGSGTGHDVQRFAELVGSSGRAVGVEPNARMRAVAAERAAAAASVAEFVDGDATALPFDDGSVDVVRSERVFQHLDAPERAAAEVARVLAPGGRAAIVDTDWGTAVLHPGDPDVIRRLHGFQWTEWANPASGRRLPKLLIDAGLTVEPDIGSTALIFPQAVVESAPMIQQASAAAVAGGAITAEERAELLDGLRRAAQEGWAMISVTMYAVVARRAA